MQSAWGCFPGGLPWGVWVGGAGGGGATGQSMGVWGCLGLLGSQTTHLLHSLVESTEQVMAVVSLLLPSTSCSSSASSSSICWDICRSCEIAEPRSLRAQPSSGPASLRDLCPNTYGFWKPQPWGLAFQLPVPLCPRVGGEQERCGGTGLSIPTMMCSEVLTLDLY